MKGLKAVADAENRLDILVGVVAELFAQAADVDVERARADLGAIAPDAHQQRLARDDLAGVLDEQRQQVVLFAGEDHALRSRMAACCVEIDGEMLVAIWRNGINMRSKAFPFEALLIPIGQSLKWVAWKVMAKV